VIVNKCKVLFSILVTMLDTIMGYLMEFVNGPSPDTSPNPMTERGRALFKKLF
jgi:hypothetical protein